MSLELSNHHKRNSMLICGTIEEIVSRSNYVQDVQMFKIFSDNTPQASRYYFCYLNIATIRTIKYSISCFVINLR